MKLINMTLTNKLGYHSAKHKCLTEGMVQSIITKLDMTLWEVELEWLNETDNKVKSDTTEVPF